MNVIDNGAPDYRFPAGKTLGRIMDVLGNPIDEAGPIGEAEQERLIPIHRSPPSYAEQAAANELLGNWY